MTSFGKKSPSIPPLPYQLIKGLLWNPHPPAMYPSNQPRISFLKKPEILTTKTNLKFRVHKIQVFGGESQGEMLKETFITQHYKKPQGI